MEHVSCAHMHVFKLVKYIGIEWMSQKISKCSVVKDNIKQISKDNGQISVVENTLAENVHYTCATHLCCKSCLSYSGGYVLSNFISSIISEA
jgi:hypothetical protein